MIRGIIFDCFGVLYQGSLEYLRSITPQERLNELEDLKQAADYGYISHHDYIDQVGALTGRPGREIDEVTRARHVRNESVIELAKTLRGSYKIALLSNMGRDILDGLFSPEEREQLFDAVVVSSDIGMVKPDAAVFEFTASKLGVSPGECIMIDDLPVNIEGADAVGMRGVLYSNTLDLKRSLVELLEGKGDA